MALTLRSLQPAAALERSEAGAIEPSSSPKPCGRARSLLAAPSSRSPSPRSSSTTGSTSRATPASRRRCRRPGSWAASLAWIVVTVAILGLRAEFPAAYYGIRSFERSGRLYRDIGVHVALRFMPHGEYVNRVARRLRAGSGPIKGPDSARRWLRETRSKEFGHLSHLLMRPPAACLFLANGRLASLATVAALDVAGDLYPVMGQRYNRIRLERMFAAKRTRASEPRAPIPTPRARR